VRVHRQEVSERDDFIARKSNFEGTCKQKTAFYCLGLALQRLLISVIDSRAIFF
jgi:hypothetical protein